MIDFSNPLIQNILVAISGVVVGGLITFFSQPIIEKRKAYVRIAEKIADKKIEECEKMWMKLSELDKSSVFYQENYTTEFIKKYPMAIILVNHGNLNITSKIFLSYDSFKEFINDFTALYISSSIWNKEILLEFKIIFNYLQFINNYLDQSMAVYNLILESDKISKVPFDEFVVDVGILIFNEIIKKLSDSNQKIIKNFSKPRFFIRKKKLDIRYNKKIGLAVKRSIIYVAGKDILRSWLISVGFTEESIAQYTN